MGVYKKIGLRNVGLRAIELINFIRLYQFRNGFSIFRSLRKPNKNFFRVRASFFKAPVLLRNNDSDPAIFMQVFYEQQYELYGVAFPQVKTIIDAGANVGLAAIYFSIRFPDAAIVAIEPEKDNFCLLEQNTLPYKNIECVRGALWYKDEPVYITNPETAAAGFIVDGNIAKGDSIEGVTVETIVKRKKWDIIDILKIDIEGAEKEIFSASDCTWLNKVKLLIIETHDRYKSGTVKALFNTLQKFDYNAHFHHENIFIFFKELSL